MMDGFYRIRIRPQGAWRTPWQADTITGLLCWMCVRMEGEAVLRQLITEPMLAGEPPFVLSDAFPGEFLPLPVAIRLGDWPVDLRKTVKRARWLRREAFLRVCRGESVDAGDLVLASPIVEHDQIRNTVGRATGTTGAGGSLFTLSEFRLDTRDDELTGADELSIYVRVRPGNADLLLNLFEELASVGFGADASVGKGVFGFPTGAPELEPLDFGSPLRSEPTNAMVALSTFQPGHDDPAAGVWEAFVKHGKLGPGLAGDAFAKNPIVLFRPGACFSAPLGGPPFVGRAIPMDEILDPAVAADLRDRGIEVVHPAFGLIVPAKLRLP